MAPSMCSNRRTPVALGALAAAVGTVLLLPSLPGAHAYPDGVGSCAEGFAKFPEETEHNWYNELGDNWGDLAFADMVVTLGGVELGRPEGSDQFHYAGECDETYKCGMCQGNCGSNDDCADGLECLTREEDEEVPGCSGTVGLWDGVSYCYEPSGRRKERALQGQMSETGVTFETGTALRLTLEAPDDKPFLGFMFRLQGDDPGQNLAGSIVRVEESDVPMKILGSVASGEGNEDETYPDFLVRDPVCDEGVAAACHAGAQNKELVEVDILVPAGAAGGARLEVTAMVSAHEFYLTSYRVTFAQPTPPAPEVNTGGGDGGETPTVVDGTTEPPAATDPPATGGDETTKAPPAAWNPEDCTFPPALACSRIASSLSSPVLDGDLSEWTSYYSADASSPPFVSTPLTTAMGASLYSAGRMMLRCAYDSERLYLAAEVPGRYRHRLSSTAVTESMAAAEGDKEEEGGHDDDHDHDHDHEHARRRRRLDGHEELDGDDHGDHDHDHEHDDDADDIAARKTSAAISTMMKVGSEASFYHMGGCTQSCSSAPDGESDGGPPEECLPHAVDVGGYFLAADAASGVETSGLSSFGAVSSYCRIGDGDGSEGGWSAAWSHTAPGADLVLENEDVAVEPRNADASGGVEGARGTYVFEMSRKLVVAPEDAISGTTVAPSLVAGETYSFGVAFWDPYEDEEDGWSRAGHYVTGCSRDWMDLVLLPGEEGGNESSGTDGDDGDDGDDLSASARSGQGRDRNIGLMATASQTAASAVVLLAGAFM